MRRASAALLAVFLAIGIAAAPAAAAPEDFGLETVESALSSAQAGAHPDVTLVFDMKKNPASPPNTFGLKDSYAATRNVRIDLPPGLAGNPNVLGVPQQCTVEQLVTWQAGGGCPNGSQVGITKIFAYDLLQTFTEPVYMMTPPGGDVVARLGFIAGIFPTFIDFRVRSESDYGLVADITDASAQASLVRAETTTWGVPAHPSHNTERCTAKEAFGGCTASEPRPPGSQPLPFITNPTRCAVPLELRVSASSWVFPDRFDSKAAPFPPISGCERLPFGADLVVEPTTRRPAAPTGIDLTVRVPSPDGSDVLEPSQVRQIRIDLPEGVAVNPGSADGLGTCSAEQVRFEKRAPSECPDSAKLAAAEFDIPALPRRMRGAIYLREPQPGNPFRVWVVADDLGAHVKLPGQLEIDRATGQISSVVPDIPQFPVREAKLIFFPGSRAPLLTPPACGEYRTDYVFTPWSGTLAVRSFSPMAIDRDCEVDGFSPRLAAGTTNLAAGEHSPFVFTLSREDGEGNPAALDIALPTGLAASFRGITRCEGAHAASGACPDASRIGHVRTAVGAGATPLWVPQAGKRPTAVYLGGPYKGGPLSIIAVVPAQAGPFDFGDEVVRSAIYVDPRSAQATVKSDALPQIIEGVPIPYRQIHVAVDRPGFTLNPTSCAAKEIAATVTSSKGQVATPSARFRATDCASLDFKPRISLRLRGGTKRGGHPALRAVVRPRPGDANISRTVVKLPRSAFLDQAHIRTICTRVQFAAEQCPPGSVYGNVRAFSPLLDDPLEGPAILRSSDNLLPDLVFDLKGLVDIEAVGRIDSVKGGIRATFEDIPDAPLTKVVVNMQGGKKGLIVNSRNLCAGPSRAKVAFEAHNGKAKTLRPAMRAKCGTKKKSRKRHSRQP